MEDPIWFEKILGIGYETSKKLSRAMMSAGFLSTHSGTMQIAADPKLYRELKNGKTDS